MPEVLVTGGGGSFEGLAATLMQLVRNRLPSPTADADAPIDAELAVEEPGGHEEEAPAEEPAP